MSNKLDDLYGLANSKESISNYIYYLSIAKKDYYANFNVLIEDYTNNSFETKNNLVEYLFKYLKKNGIIKKMYYFSENDLRDLEDEFNHENDLIIIDGERINIRSTKNENAIVNLLLKYSKNVYFIIHSNDYDGEITNTFLPYVDWSFKIEEPSKDDKITYINGFFQKNSITIQDNMILEDYLCKQTFSNIKLELVQITTKCKKNNISNINWNNYCLVADVGKPNDNIIESKYLKTDLDFDSIIGLNEVKVQIKKIVNYLKVCKEKGIKRPSTHMCFTGNPGTGKTTMARILGEMLANEQILSNRNFVEVHGRDLVGKYVGWTSEKVKKIVNTALGGCLFIDEAYALDSDRKSFEDEAIATLIKEMEDKREDICIIFAGYKNEMNEFIHRNPGLESRIQFYLDFPDYEVEEISKIFDLMVKNEHYRISNLAQNMLNEYFCKNKNSKFFSNGRFVRNTFEKIKIEQASRIISENKKSNVITLEDVENAIKCTNNVTMPKKEIGFETR